MVVFPIRYALRFPIHHTQPFPLHSYALLLSDKHHTPRNWHHAPLDHCVRAATTILSTANLHGSQVGKTRVFLKAGHLAALESARTMRITKAVVSIQSAWRGVSARQYAATRVVAVVRVQTVVRGWLARCELQRLRRERAALRVQCAWRMWSCRRVLLHHRRCVVVLGGGCSGGWRVVFLCGGLYVCGGFCMMCACTVVELCTSIVLAILHPKCNMVAATTVQNIHCVQQYTNNTRHTQYSSSRHHANPGPWGPPPPPLPLH